MADDDVEIELTDEPIKESDAGTKSPGGGAPALDSVSTDIAEVQRRLDESEQRTAKAERERDAAVQRAAQVETSATGDRLAMVQSALDTIDANVATLQSQMAEAMAAGDFAKHSELNVALAKQLAAQPDLLRGKAALEHQAKQPAAPLPGQLTDTQKIELYTQTMEPRAKAWIQAHPQYVLDSKLNDRLLARHYSAKDAGHKEGTDGYFQFIEAGLGLPAPNGHAAPDPAPPAGTGTEQPLSAAAAPIQRRGEAQPPAAAPSRGNGSGRLVKMSPAEAEAASISGLTREEYMRNKERELKAGNIGPKRLN